MPEENVGVAPLFGKGLQIRSTSYKGCRLFGRSAGAVSALSEWQGVSSGAIAYKMAAKFQRFASASSAVC